MRHILFDKGVEMFIIFFFHDFDFIIVNFSYVEILILIVVGL